MNFWHGSVFCCGAGCSDIELADARPEVQMPVSTATRLSSSTLESSPWMQMLVNEGMKEAVLLEFSRKTHPLGLPPRKYAPAHDCVSHLGFRALGFVSLTFIQMSSFSLAITHACRSLLQVVTANVVVSLAGNAGSTATRLCCCCRSKYV